MSDFKWSNSEKNHARDLFDQALAAELAETLADFKVRAAAASTAEAMWAIGSHLAATRHDIDGKYDFRYSQLIFVFARLRRERRIQDDQLAGLSDEKRALIRQIAEM